MGLSLLFAGKPAHCSLAAEALLGVSLQHLVGLSLLQELFVFSCHAGQPGMDKACINLAAACKDRLTLCPVLRLCNLQHVEYNEHECYRTSLNFPKAASGLTVRLFKLLGEGNC